MESTPPTSKRVKTRAVRSGGRLEGWFSGDNDLIERYRFETSTKVINNPKVVSFDWLKSQKLDNVRRLLKDQSLRKFLEMKGNIYPDLIRVFYTNLKVEGNNLVSHVKGVDMEITYDVWTAVAGLKYSGIKINKGNLGVVEDFNKVQYYKSCLKNQNAQVRTCSVGGLMLDERLLALIVTWHSNFKEEQSFCSYRGGPCVYLLHNEEDHNQLEPYHQGTHAKGNEVK